MGILNDLDRQLRSVAIWVEPKDRLEFDRIMLDMREQAGRYRSRAAVFRHVLDVYGKHKELKRDAGRKGE